MNLQQLKDMLENARDAAGSASSYAEDANSNADRANDYANDAYSKIDDIMDNLDNFVGFDPEQLRDHTVLIQRMIRLQGFLARRCMEIIDGSGVERLETDNVKGLATIIDRLVEYNTDGTEVAKFDQGYQIRWDYNTGAYVVERKETNNG